MGIPVNHLGQLAQLGYQGGVGFYTDLEERREGGYTPSPNPVRSSNEIPQS